VHLPLWRVSRRFKMFKSMVRPFKFRAQALPPPETSKKLVLKPFLEHWQNLSNLAHFGSVSSFCGQGLTVPSTLVEGVINAYSFVEGVINASTLVEAMINTGQRVPQQARSGQSRRANLAKRTWGRLPLWRV